MNFIFPQYRKLSNEHSFYKVEDANTLLEIQRIGNNWTEHKLTARILPERNLIADILENEGNRYVTIDEQAFETFHSFCRENLKRF